MSGRALPAALVLAALVVPAAAAAQPRVQGSTGTPERVAQDRDELEEFMKQALENRDTAWRALGDFTLREILTVEIEAPLEVARSGLRLEHAWSVRDGVARSRLVRFHEVAQIDDRRRDAEADWPVNMQPRAPESGRDDVEPKFLDDAFYFSRFVTLSGRYYMAGREIIDGREVVRVEFYPDRSDQGYDAPLEDAAPGLPERTNRWFNTTTLVTFWVDPDTRQIIKSAFRNPGLDYLRYRWLVRVDSLDATTEMVQVGDVWMPARSEVTVRVTTARGEYVATMRQEFTDYRKADQHVGPDGRVDSR